MPFQVVNIGTSANDGTGDPLRTAFNKVNQNFAALPSGLTLLGTWNASTNTPTLTDGAGTDGTYYIVNVAGSTTLGGISTWNVGDFIIRVAGAWTRFAAGANVLAGDGTAAAPSISFAADTNTGLYRIEADTLGVTTNGAERWRFTSAGIFQAPGAQTIRTATGTLTLATAAGDGNINLTPHGTGKVGIGTTNPSTLFAVAGPLSLEAPGYASIANGASITVDIQNIAGALLNVHNSQGGNAANFTSTLYAINGRAAQGYAITALNTKDGNVGRSFTIAQSGSSAAVVITNTSGATCNISVNQIRL